MTKAEQQQHKREHWQQRIAEYRASGQSGAAWCAEQGIKPHLLYYWVQQFASSSTDTSTTSLQWQPVLVSDRRHKKTTGSICVRVGAATIEIAPDFDEKTLTDVVRVLAAVC
jgi:transposase-like protein